MKTTINIDQTILERASRLTGVQEKTKLVRMGLEALISRYSARRLAALGGSEPSAQRIPMAGIAIDFSMKDKPVVRQKRVLQEPR